MILGIIVDDQRAEVIKYSKEIIYDDISILSAKSEHKYKNNVLWHLKDLDVRIWCVFVFMAIIVAVIIKYMKKMTFTSAIWIVLGVTLLKRKKTLNSFY